MLNCIDNSGATLVECVARLRMKTKHAQIGMPAWKSKWYNSPIQYWPTQGDRIIVVVQKTRSLEGGPSNTAAALNRVKRGEIKHAIVVRCAKEVQRKDGMLVKFDDNACALIGKNGEPLGTRINGECETEFGVLYIRP